MASELLRLQWEFARLVPRLIDHAHKLGYQATFGDAYRDSRVHGALGVKVGYGHARSAHKVRLAIDVNLYLKGEYLQLTSDHQALGEWWEKQHPRARWGGRFNDGNHYSLEWNGVK